MRESFLVFGRPVLGDAEIDEVVDSLRSGWIGTGPKVQRFEAMLSEYLSVPYVRCVSSCTAALMLGLKTLGVGPGDDVLVPSLTFVASANAVEHVAKYMQEKQVRRVLILNREKRLVGVVSLGDIAKASGEKELAGETLGEIAEAA